MNDCHRKIYLTNSNIFVSFWAETAGSPEESSLWRLWLDLRWMMPSSPPRSFLNVFPDIRTSKTVIHWILNQVKKTVRFSFLVRNYIPHTVNSFYFKQHNHKKHWKTILVTWLYRPFAFVTASPQTLLGPALARCRRCSCWQHDQASRLWLKPVG